MLAFTTNHLSPEFTMKFIPYVFLFCVCFCFASNLAAAEGEQKYKILILTGGHDFEKKEFYKMFDDMPGIEYDKAELPQDMDLLAPGLEKKYDLLLTYDMNSFPTTDKQLENYAALIKSGMPLLVFHHSLCGYENRPLYREMIGGQYLQKPMEIDGKKYPASAYKHGETINVTIADKKHPIMQGIDDFAIIDETYKDVYVRDDVHVLMTTDNPTSTKQLAWTHKFGKGSVFTIALGHDHISYENPNLPKILLQGIKWCIADTKQSK